MRNGIKTFFVLIIALVIVGSVSKLYFTTMTEVVNNCKVERLVQQQIISNGDNGSISTGYRYLVITNKETFICESSLLNGKFNNSDIFFRLKEGETYNFKVAGYGKTFFTDYRNLLDIEPKQ
jgi:hypothetical protein